MFAQHCTDCDRRMLVFPGQIREVAHTGHGFLVTYTCWCGSTQTWSPATAERPLVAA
jgi:hypothetical protein